MLTTRVTHKLTLRGIPWTLGALVSVLTVTVMSGCRPTSAPASQGIYMVDAGGRPVRSLQVGSSLHISGAGLQPQRLYQLSLTVGGSAEQQPISFSRVTTDSTGVLPSHILWYHSGVVGCSLRNPNEERLPLFMYRSFDEAETDLASRSLQVVIQPVQNEQRDTRPLMELPLGEVVHRMDIPVRQRESPMVFPSDAQGCLVNSLEVATGDMFVRGRSFSPDELVEISVVANQRSWHIGDPIHDVSGRGGAEPVRIRADSKGRFVASVWPSEIQQRGAYDIVVRRRFSDDTREPRIRRNDIISYSSDTAFLLFLRYPVGGPLMDIAGRPISGSPYFEFADSFAETADPVWGAVDPTYVPSGHPGGRYAAYYVVQHRNAMEWGASNNLVDVSGGIEITPVKAGCINGTDIPIWDTSPLTSGDYDVVVNFGSTPAETSASYTDDFTYDPVIDFLDGADQIGFVVARDPNEHGSFAVGRATYSQDDFFASLGNANDVDLRAIVRYPAVSPGGNTPVASGQHPLFVIEHGNHLTCNITRSGQDPYDLLAAGTLTFDDLYNYDDCPDRKENHAGYNDLLAILASRGIIAVSIDAYDLTSCTQNGCRPQWIAERGELILKHLELWGHLNDSGQFPSYPDFFSGAFNGHVDLGKLSVSGHSRGGEASVAAYMINLSSPTPFAIGSVSSIAPVDGQSYVMPDVSYLVILPAADGDVSSLSGARIYDRAGTVTDDTIKSGIHVYGANHNFFNTVWAADGDDASTPRDDYIAAVDQQRLGETYLAAFTMAELLGGGMNVYQDMLRGRLVFPSTAGFKIHHMRHEKNHRKVEAGSLAGTPDTISATVVNGPSVHETAAVQLNWSSGAAKLTYAISSGDVSSFEVISFRAAQTGSSSNPASGSQEFRIELVGGGQQRAVYTGRFDPIPKPYDRPGSDHNVMTTVRVPLHSFIMNNSNVDLQNIDTVRLLFSQPSSGEIYIDDIEFSR